MSFDVRLLKEQEPIFPTRCVACGSDAPGGTLRFHTRSVGWSTFVSWSYGEKFSADVPVCGICRGKVKQQRWLRSSIRMSLGIIGILIAGWWLFLTDSQEPLKAEPSGSIVGKVLGRLLTDFQRSWLMMGTALVCALPWLLWEIFFPPPFDMTAYADSVDYQFRDAEYAEEFAVLNKAAGEAEQVSSDGEEA